MAADEGHDGGGTAAALIIGNEILSGKVEDTNSPLLARTLRDLGVELRRILVVPDEVEEIVAGLRLLTPAHDMVFTSGGVGPTHDDVTLRAVAAALGRGLQRHAGLASRVAAHYDVGKFPEALRMADLPEGAQLVAEPGLGVPVVQVENVFVLPGLPRLFARKVEALRGRLRREPFHLREVWVDRDETELAAILDRLATEWPGLQLGSYPAVEEDDPRVKLTLESKDLTLVEGALGVLLGRLPAGSWARRP